MPKKTISERFVQEAVHQQLNRKYYRRKPIYAGMESYTGLKRADVMLAFMRAPNRPYVVVVECKSRTTIGQLKLQADEQGNVWVGRLLAAAILLGVGTALGWNWYFNALNTSLLLGVFVGLVVILGSWLGRMELFFLQSVKAIEQLAGYPANESWIAISEDTFSNANDYRQLRRQCQKNRIGLIVVDQAGRLRLKLKPRAIHVFNDYLARYGKKRKILARIDRGSGYGPTPAERAKRWRQSAVGLGGLLLVGAVGALGYEASNGPVLPDPIAAEVDLWPETIGTDTLMTSSPIDSSVLEQTNRTNYSRACEELIFFEGRNFLLADLLCPDETCAIDRSRQLVAAGLKKVGFLSTDCFSSSLPNNHFLVYTGHFERRVTTQSAARQQREILSMAGLEEALNRPLRIREK